MCYWNRHEFRFYIVTCWAGPLGSHEMKREVWFYEPTRLSHFGIGPYLWSGDLLSSLLRWSYVQRGCYLVSLCCIHLFLSRKGTVCRPLYCFWPFEWWLRSELVVEDLLMPDSWSDLHIAAAFSPELPVRCSCRHTALGVGPTFLGKKGLVNKIIKY